MCTGSSSPVNGSMNHVNPVSVSIDPLPLLCVLPSAEDACGGDERVLQVEEAEAFAQTAAPHWEGVP